MKAVMLACSALSLLVAAPLIMQWSSGRLPKVLAPSTAAQLGGTSILILATLFSIFTSPRSSNKTERSSTLTKCAKPAITGILLVCVLGVVVVGSAVASRPAAFGLKWAVKQARNGQPHLALAVVKSPRVAAVGRQSKGLALLEIRRALIRKNDDARAKSLLVRARKLIDGSAPLERALGEQALSDGKVALALKHLKRSLELESSPSTHVSLGAAYAKLEKTDKAKRAYQAALVLDERAYMARIGLGLIYVRQGKLDKARAEFQRAVWIRPFEPLFFYYVGSVYVAQKRMAAAERNFRNAAALAPDSSHYALTHARCLYLKGDKGKARVVLQLFLDRHPGNVKVERTLEKIR